MLGGLDYKSIGTRVKAWLAALSNVPILKGDLWTSDGSINQRFPVGTDGRPLIANSGQADGLEYAEGFARKNPIINGAFRINQRLPATNADDTYAHDRWNALTQANPIAVSTLADVENGLPFMARVSQANAAAQRFGYAQIIEGKDCKHLRGKTVTFRFGRERLSIGANIRIAVLEWTGGEDAVTSDVVNDWTSAVYTPGNFFLGANLTVSGVVQQALVANTLTDGASVTVNLGGAFNNLIVFAWTEAAAAQNVTLDLGWAQLEVGSVATEYARVPFELDLLTCQRFYAKTFPQATAPAQNAGRTGAFEVFAQPGGVNSGGEWQYPVVMRTSPTIVTYNPQVANANWRDYTSPGDKVVVVQDTSARRTSMQATGTGNNMIGIHITADAEL